MVEGLENLEQIEQVVQSISCPVLFNIYECAPDQVHQIKDLEAAGVKLIVNCLTTTPTATLLRISCSLFGDRAAQPPITNR